MGIHMIKCTRQLLVALVLAESPCIPTPLNFMKCRMQAFACHMNYSEILREDICEKT